MRWPSWLWHCTVWLLLAVVLWLAPPAFEGPILLRFGLRHALTGMDLVALLPLGAAGWGVFNGLLHRPQPSGGRPAALPVWAFAAGVACGLAVAARFAYLAVHWPAAVIVLLLVMVMGLFPASRH